MQEAALEVSGAEVQERATALKEECGVVKVDVVTETTGLELCELPAPNSE